MRGIEMTGDIQNPRLNKSFSVPELNEIIEVMIIQNLPGQMTIVFNDGIKYFKKKT